MNTDGISRRAFIKSGLLMGLYAMSLGNPYKGFSNTLPSHEALVIGAGAAGLAAAATLQRQGFRVKVLEARNRFGGRVWTDRSLGLPVDLGASWIHGVQGNPITKLARKYNIKTTETNYDDIMVYGHNKKIYPDQRLEELEMFVEELTEAVEEQSEVLTRDTSVGQLIQQVLRGESLTIDEKIALNWWMATQEVAAAEDLNRLSVFYTEADESFGGSDHLFPGGYDQIFKHMASGLDIRYNHVVHHIEYDDSGVRVHTNKGLFKADGAIITVPLGVLKKGKIKFTPALPAYKQQAIRRLEMGVLNKVALKFSSTFWDRNHDFLGYVAQEKGIFPTILNGAKLTGKPYLMAFTGGSVARELETYSNTEIAEELVDILQGVYGSRVSELQGMKVSRWASDPFSYGSYSHVPVGASPKDFDALAKPVSPLFFAGEATTKEYPGTVHGAYLSGIREAQRIISLV